MGISRGLVDGYWAWLDRYNPAELLFDPTYAKRVQPVLEELLDLQWNLKIGRRKYTINSLMANSIRNGWMMIY